MQDSDSPDGRGWQGGNGSPAGDNDIAANVPGDADGKAYGPAKDAAGVLAEAVRALRTAESDLGKLHAIRDAATDLTRLGANDAISDLEDIARDVGNLTSIEIGAALTNSAKQVEEAAAYYSAELYEIRPKFEPSAEIIRLARLKLIDYEQERSAAAKRLGMRASALDLFVKAQRSEAASGDNRQGRALRIPDVDPWHDPVAGAELLDEITRTILRYLALPESTAQTVAVWAVHTHCYDAFTISPRLAITSPEKGCGKTTLLDILSCMVARPLPVCNAKVAAIFRVVEMTKPTLLMDEADTYFHDNDELRGILNAGHRKGGYVLRCEGDDLEPRMFSTWAPAAIAAIGKLPDTLNDRAVPCRMHRRKPSEKVKSFRIDRTDDLAVLARKAARWAADSEEFLRKADPDVGALSNRVADNWRPLLAIADAAGSQWPARIQAASVKAASRDDPSIRVQLLKDIKAFFNERGDPHAVFGRELLDHLISMDDRRWGEWSRGKPMSRTQLSTLLAPFEVYSSDVRVGNATAKGYYRTHFDDAFAAYTPDPAATSRQSLQDSDFSNFQSATTEIDVALQKTRLAYSRSDCRDVAAQIPPQGTDGHLDPSEGPEPDDWWRDTEPEDEGPDEFD
jgi:putative DNA primase/helicase